DYHFGFQKQTERSELLMSQFNEMINDMWSKGEIDRLIEKWLEGPESEKVIDESGLTGENGELLVAVLSDYPPFSYYLNNKLTGYLIDLTTEFAHRYGYSIKYEETKVATMIAGISTGKYDIAAYGLSYTEERAKSIDFSDVIYKGGMMLMTRAQDVTGPDIVSYSSGTSSEVKSFDGKKLGIWVGTSFEKPTLEIFPNSEYLYFDNDTDMILALDTGKIDGFIIDEPIARMASKENSNLSYFKEPLVEDNYCFGFEKDSERSATLVSQFNEMINELWNNGEADKLIAKWVDGPENEKVIDKTGLSGENGNIRICILSDNPPFSYYLNNELTGYAMELTYMFGRRYGYSVDFEETTITAALAGVVSGKYDMGAMGFSPTEERKKSMQFSDTFYHGGLVFMGRKADIESGTIDTHNVAEPDYTEYIGKRIGIQTGSASEDVTLEKLPNSEYVYFENISDLLLALQQNKIDAFVDDEPVAREIEKENPEITYLKKILVKDDYCLGFQKGTETSEIYRKQFNEMLSEMRANGEIDRLINKWFAGNDDEKTIDRSGLTGENGALKLAARSNKPPFSYFENGEFTGYAVELVTMFARRYGYSLEFEDANLSAMLAGLSANKYDIGVSCWSVTEERKSSIDFSDPFYNGGMVLIIRSEDLKSSGTDLTSAVSNTEEKKSFLKSVADSFEKNFVKEDRWKLILQGIGTTCAITVLTVLFGSILAFLICMLRRVDSVLAGKICNIYVKLLQGTPMVVLLMILYYVVFGKSSFDAIWVAVIGFSLNFGAYGSEIMRSGIESIDNGQREAALALGFTENQGFFKFIFPQAAVRFLPVYRGEIISLLKNTSIVGYIAIQDLTKKIDIIRSRTFEAFFPLIATAVIYFILAWVISFALAKVLKVVDPKQNKKKTVKGVTMK
ncbi:MAG: ABC transporter permease subunit, partial [Lachnospiraceae bacterium]|nr:ABC transporter permease subunit [Lachnospiraceae bacterium]